MHLNNDCSIKQPAAVSFKTVSQFRYKSQNVLFGKKKKKVTYCLVTARVSLMLQKSGVNIKLKHFFLAADDTVESFHWENRSPRKRPIAQFCGFSGL